MQSRTLLNLSLASIALVLGLVIYYQPGLNTDTVTAPITALSAGDIDSIRVTREERTPLTFVKTPAGWQIKNHQGVPASEFQLHALLGILSARPARSYPENALDLASAGLDPPQATLLLNDTLINIGGTTPLDRQRYVQYDNTIYLLNDTYQHLVNADWTNFVERRLIPKDAELAGLQLPGITLTRDTAQQWKVSSTDTDSHVADPAAWVQHWQAANATYIRRYDGAGGGAPITLTLAGDQPAVELLLLSSSPELVLARPAWGIQYYFPGGMSTALLGRPADDADKEPVNQPVTLP